MKSITADIFGVIDQRLPGRMDVYQGYANLGTDGSDGAIPPVDLRTERYRIIGKEVREKGKIRYVAYKNLGPGIVSERDQQLVECRLIARKRYTVRQIIH